VRRARRDRVTPVSTRKLILLALLCGLALIVAFALQLFIAR
jgi:hypothetical protein